VAWVGGLVDGWAGGKVGKGGLEEGG